MCGIVGIGFLGKLDRKEEIQRQEVGQYLLTELLVETQTRGSDATGVGVVFDNGNYIGLKNGISAVDFITQNEDKDTSFTGLMNAWSQFIHKPSQFRDAKIVMGHCRKSSVGHSYSNVNNHPIHIDPIIGVHNGTLQNDDIIFKNLGCKRNGQVDSEAIMHLMYDNTNKGKDPFTIEGLEDTANKLEGAYTTLVSNSNNPYQLAFLRDDRPMEVCLIKKLNMLVIISERPFMNKVLFRYKKIVDVLPQMFKTINTEWPRLTADDVDFKTVPNRELGVFNLTEPVEKDNARVEDFMISKGIISNNKIWQSPKSNTTTYGNAGYTGNQNRGWNNRGSGYQGRHKPASTGTAEGTATGTPATDNPVSGAQAKQNRKATTANAAASNGNNDNTVVGKLWVSSLQKYKDVTADEVRTWTDKAGFLEIKEKKEENENTKAKDHKKFTGLTSAARIPVFCYKEGGIEIKEKVMPKPAENTGKAVPRNEDEKISEKDGNKSENLPVISVDASTNPIALEYTNKYKKGLFSYSNLNEVAAELGLADAKTIEQLNLIALLNRSNKKFRADGYYDGFITGFNYAVSEEHDGPEKNKKGKKRDRLISTHKFITKVISEVVQAQSDETWIGTPKNFITQILSKNRVKIDEDEFNRLFTPYEINNDPILNAFYKSIVSLQNKKGTGE